MCTHNPQFLWQQRLFKYMSERSFRILIKRQHSCSKLPVILRKALNPPPPAPAQGRSNLDVGWLLWFFLCYETERSLMRRLWQAKNEVTFVNELSLSLTVSIFFVCLFSIETPWFHMREDLFFLLLQQVTKSVLFIFYCATHSHGFMIGTWKT